MHDHEHPHPTRRSQYRYLFTAKHHGGGLADAARAEAGDIPYFQECGYDALGRRAKVTEAVGTTGTRSTSTVYDPMDYVVTERQVSGRAAGVRNCLRRSRKTTAAPDRFRLGWGGDLATCERIRERRPVPVPHPDDCIHFMI